MPHLLRRTRRLGSQPWAIAIVLFAASTVAGATSGCVSRTKYDAAVQSARDTRAAMDAAAFQAARDREQASMRMAELTQKIDALEHGIQEREVRLSEAAVQAHNLQASLDDQTAISEQLRRELTRLGKNVDQLLSERGILSQSLEQAKARLEELRRAEEAADARAALARKLTQALEKNIAAHELSVSFVAGRLFLTIPSDSVFESGKSGLKASARPLVKEIADALGRLGGGRRFEVGVHTDDQPSRGRFASNWDLSAARAAELVRRLVAAGMVPESLSAAGYSQFAPVDRNATAEGRALNRRVEISMVPRPEDLVTRTPGPLPSAPPGSIVPAGAGASASPAGAPAPQPSPPRSVSTPATAALPSAAKADPRASMVAPGSAAPGTSGPAPGAASAPRRRAPSRPGSRKAR